MPDLSWNVHSWNFNYSWSEEGEEWSAAWGNSDAQWFGVIYPRLHAFLPCDSILEIGTGYGRWTRFLIPAARKKFSGVDLAEECIDACKHRFTDSRQTSFFVNDGKSLAGTGPGPFDLVFSFDSLVHADRSVMEAYIPQIISRLSRNGVAWLHHSNLASVFREEGLDDQSLPLELRHFRDSSVSADVVKELVESNDGKCLVQEIVNWGGERPIDCLTLLCRRGSFGTEEYLRFQNRDFMTEANSVREHIHPYCRLRRVDWRS